MNNRKYDVAAIGLQCIDIVAATVTPGVLERECTLVDSARLMLGGDALNQAVTMASLGAKVALMGVVGNDQLGDVLLEQLARYGTLDVLDARCDVNTAISMVLVDAQTERHFVYQPESNNALSYAHVNEDAVKNAAFLSVGGGLSLPGLDGEGLLKLMKLARDAGARTALDIRIPDADYDRKVLSRTFALTDYLLPSEQEVRAITGEGENPAVMVEKLHHLGATNVVVKLGGKGCYVAADGFEGLVPACPCHCVDTTGAGDNFVGAFLYAKTRGWDIEKCARFANAAGSIAVEHPGANGAIRSAEQVVARMNGLA